MVVVDDAVEALVRSYDGVSEEMARSVVAKTDADTGMRLADNSDELDSTAIRAVDEADDSTFRAAEALRDAEQAKTTIPDAEEAYGGTGLSPDPTPPDISMGLDETSAADDVDIADDAAEEGESLLSSGAMKKAGGIGALGIAGTTAYNLPKISEDLGQMNITQNEAKDTQSRADLASYYARLIEEGKLDPEKAESLLQTTFETGRGDTSGNSNNGGDNNGEDSKGPDLASMFFNNPVKAALGAIILIIILRQVLEGNTEVNA